MIIKPNRKNVLFMLIIGNICGFGLLGGTVIAKSILDDLAFLGVVPNYDTITLIIKCVVVVALLFTIFYNYMVLKGATKQYIHLTADKLIVYEDKHILHEIAVDEIQGFEYKHHGGVDVGDDAQSVNFTMYLVKTTTNSDFELSTGLYASVHIQELVKHCQHINPSIQNKL